MNAPISLRPLWLAGLFLLPAVFVFAAPANPLPAPVARDVPYVQPANPRQMLDVYAPGQGANLPVVVWIHGGGWMNGDKTSIHHKPSAFVERGYVFVSINHRFLPHVTMDTLVRDVAQAVGWVHDHIANHRGDPGRLFIMGHSSGAQLAALLCTDDRYLKAEGVPFAHLRGCAPVDGDTYDVPLQIATARARRKSLGQPEPKFGHSEKFGPPDRQRDLSAVNHVSAGKGIPPFLVLHVDGHPDVTAQARRLADTLDRAGIPARIFAAADTDHVMINRRLGLPEDPATQALFAFVEQQNR